MEQTLGKRIIFHRKRMGLTQDQLAERLGVTAQAVSKWENDQSCPDITMLPKLAEIFSITIDELLGVEPSGEVHEGEVVEDATSEEAEENEGIHVGNAHFEFKLDSPVKRSSLSTAVLVLTVGGLTLASEILNWNVSFWSILWPTAILIFGLFGLLPRFSFFRTGCVIFGAYFLLDNLNVLPFEFGWNLVLPLILLIFGLSLLIGALRKPRWHYHFKRKRGQGVSYSIDGEAFNVSASFGETRREIVLPHLSYGNINVSFGEGEVDLSGVGAVSDECVIDANCSFGELTLLIPSRFAVQCANNTAFAEVHTRGTPDPNPQGIIYVNANVSFGEMSIRYI